MTSPTDIEPPAMEYATTYYEPPDVIEAHTAWGAACGPCALAALLGVRVNDVRPHFPAVTTERTWCNPTQMRAALASAGRVYQMVHGPAEPRTPAAMVLIQFTGPWTAGGANPRWAATHTHWVAARFGERGRRWVYDVNASGWTPVADWARVTVAELLRERPRADGWRTKLSLVLP